MVVCPGLLFNGNIWVLEAVDNGAAVTLYGVRVHVHHLEQGVESYVSTRRRGQLITCSSCWPLTMDHEGGGREGEGGNHNQCTEY